MYPGCDSQSTLFVAMKQFDLKQRAEAIGDIPFYNTVN
jgi:hypothetical protein